MQAELNYWTKLVNELTKGCKGLSQKEKKLMSICHETTYPRYKKDLYLEESSFKGKKVLDLGCGPHGGLIGFTDCDKYGVDHLIEEYKKIGYPLDKHGIKYYQAKSEKLLFPNSYFDVVICINALDHVDSLRKTIKEISRILRKDGIFIAQINFHDNATITEPIVLNHKMLIRMLVKNNMILVKRIFQYRINQEDRYYYECKKI
jgi:ubiquinone/menaquinone biosynthesis C-methylase UbiE